MVQCAQYAGRGQTSRRWGNAGDALHRTFYTRCVSLSTCEPERSLCKSYNPAQDWLHHVHDVRPRAFLYSLQSRVSKNPSFCCTEGGDNGACGGPRLCVFRQPCGGRLAPLSSTEQGWWPEPDASIAELRQALLGRFSAPTQ